MLLSHAVQLSRQDALRVSSSSRGESTSARAHDVTAHDFTSASRRRPGGRCQCRGGTHRARRRCVNASVPSLPRPAVFGRSFSLARRGHNHHQWASFPLALVCLRSGIRSNQPRALAPSRPVSALTYPIGVVSVNLTTGGGGVGGGVRHHALRRLFGSNVPKDPTTQATFLRDLNRSSPESVVELYESGKVAASEANLGEYLKVRVARMRGDLASRTPPSPRCRRLRHVNGLDTDAVSGGHFLARGDALASLPADEPRSFVSIARRPADWILPLRASPPHLPRRRSSAWTA